MNISSVTEQGKSVLTSSSTSVVDPSSRSREQVGSNGCHSYRIGGPRVLPKLFSLREHCGCSALRAVSVSISEQEEILLRLSRAGAAVPPLAAISSSSFWVSAFVERARARKPSTRAKREEPSGSESYLGFTSRVPQNGTGLELLSGLLF